MEILGSAARSRQEGDRGAESEALTRARTIDPGNYQLAGSSAVAGIVRGKDLAALAREIGDQGRGGPEAALAAARLLEIAGEQEESLGRHREACAAGGAACVVDLAIRLARMQRYEEALGLLQPLADADPDADLSRLLGEMYFASQDTYRAGQAFARAAELRPGDPDILLRQGDCFAAVRDHDAAKAKYEMARAALPGPGLPEQRLGDIALQQGDRKAAVEHYRRGLDLDTNTTAGTLLLGRLLAEKGMTEEALSLFLDAAARDTRSGSALYFAAESAAAADRLNEAEEYLRQSIEREPGNPAAIYQLARLVVHKGDPADGGKLLTDLAAHAGTEIARVALRDPIFSGAPPDSPLRKGLERLREEVVRLHEASGASRAAAGEGAAREAPNP
jgi:tetratricopeptide (TPR) repeat protein